MQTSLRADRTPAKLMMFFCSVVLKQIARPIRLSRIWFYGSATFAVNTKRESHSPLSPQKLSSSPVESQ